MLLCDVRRFKKTNTVKILKIRTPEKFAVITLKFDQFEVALP